MGGRLGTAAARPIVVAVALALALPGVAPAQVHRSRQPTVTTMRESYLEEVAKLTGETVERFKRAFSTDDTDGFLKEFTPGGHYSPPTGESLYGPDAIKVVLATRLAQFGGLSLTRTDWTASGNLAYLFGRYYYGPTHVGGEAEQGSYVMVLLQEGRDWKVRSYVERADPGHADDRIDD